MLNGVSVYISCFKIQSAWNFFHVWMVSSSGWNSTLFCFLFLFTIPSDPVGTDLFKVNMLNGVMFTSAVSKLRVRESSFAFEWFPPVPCSLAKWKQKKSNLLGGVCVEICLNEVMSPYPGEFLFDASAQSPPSDKMIEMLHFSYSRINGADFWTVVDLFNRVVWSKRKVYQNRLQEGDLKVPLCGFGSVKCVCFFVWNLELILSSFKDRSSDSVLPCLLLLHCQVRCCKSTQITLKLRKNKDDSKEFLKICKLISNLTLSLIIVSNLTNMHKLNTHINYAWIH